jgi:hypothetical protein
LLSIPGGGLRPEKRIGGPGASRYNSRIVRILPLVILVALCLTYPCSAQASAPAAAQEFAARIAALAGPGTATLTTVNSSSATAEQYAIFRKALQRSLQDAGVRLRQSAQANSDIGVTLSENARGLVYLAEVKQGSETRAVVMEAPRIAAPPEPASAMTLRRSLLVSRAEPVLDAALLRVSGENRLAVLSARAVVMYRQQAGKWDEESSAPITHSQPLPLDLRGHLVHTGEFSLEAYLPGTVCTINLAGAIHADCRDADDAWPLGAQAAFFNSGRNYFNGLLRPGFGRQLPPFFSAASLPYPGYTLWIFAGVDGEVRTNDGSHQGALNARDWGSDLASVHSGCGSGTQLLVTSVADAGGHDSLRAFELVERQPVMTAPAMEFAGTITALWTAHDASSAMAILRDARTANYEVFNVSIGCTP